MERAVASAANKVRQKSERMHLIFMKLVRKMGGLDNLGEYGLDEGEIRFLKEEFQN